MCSRACALQHWKPLQYEACAVQPESSPLSPQPERAHAEQQIQHSQKQNKTKQNCSQFLPTVVSCIVEDLKKYPSEINWYYQVAIMNLKS